MFQINMSVLQRYQLPYAQNYYHGGTTVYSPRQGNSYQLAKQASRQDLPQLMGQPLPTPRFKLTGEEREIIQKGSRPKLQHLRMKRCAGPANQNQIQRQSQMTSPSLRGSQKSLSKQQITASTNQEKGKVERARRQQYNLVHDQYYITGQDIRYQPTSKDGMVFSPRQAEKKRKNTFQITFSAESTEPEEEKQPTVKVQSVYVSKFSALDNERKRREKGEFINGFRKKLIEKQISEKEQIYRGLIRSSSRQSNASTRHQMKSKMKEVLDEIYTLKKSLA